MLLYGLLIIFVYTVCRIYKSYIRFVVYNRNILNVLLYGLLVNFVYTVCRIYKSYIRFVVYNNTEKRPTEPFCLGDLLGGGIPWDPPWDAWGLRKSACVVLFEWNGIPGIF